MSASYFKGKSWSETEGTDWFPTHLALRPLITSDVNVLSGKDNQNQQQKKR